MTAEQLEELLADESGRRVLKHIAPSLARRVIAAEKLVEALEFAADKLDDFSPFTGKAVETPYSAHVRSALTAYREASK